MSVEVDGKRLFTKEMTNVFQTEVIECPDCGFEYSTMHELDGAEGCYHCPCCNEANLDVENQQLKVKIERYEKALQTIMKDSELFNTTTKKTTYSYPGKVAKKALEG